MALRTVGVRLAAEVSGYVNSMRTAGRATKDFVGDLDKAAKAGQLDAVADQAGMMGLALVAGFGLAVNAAMKFDKQMSEVGAVSDATGAELEQLRDAALEAGQATSFSATEAAKAQAELAKAGLSTADILGGALTGSLSLAAAGSLDLAEAADISAKTMNIFALGGRDATHIADVLAAAANKSATDVHQMGEALKQGGLAANGAGMSLEETVGTLSAFADRALVGSDAGTSLKTALMMLQAPTDKSSKLMRELGISAYDASGNFVGTVELAGQLQTALGGLTQEQRNAALATIFGADAMRAANVLYELGADGVREYVTAVDDQGAAADVAAKKMDNLSGDIEKLTGSLETLAIESGSGATSGLRTIVQAADNLVSSLSQIPGPLQTAAVALAGVGGAALLAMAGMTRLKSASAPALEQVAAMGPRGERAARGLERAGRAATRAGVAFAALQVGGAIAMTFMDELNPQVEAAVKGLEEWNRQTELAGEAARLFGGDAEELERSLAGLATNGFSQTMDGVTDFILGIGGVASPLDDAKERVRAFDQALTQMVQAGNAEQAGALVEEMAKRANVSVDALLKTLPQYAGAIETAGNASASAAGGIAAVGAEAGRTADEVTKLTEAFDLLFEGQLTLDQAVLKHRGALAELREELRSGARTIALNSEEGRANRSVVLEQIEAIGQLRQARIGHGESLDAANAKYVKDIDGLRAQMQQAGFTKAQIEELTGAYREMPEVAETRVGAPGAGAAKTGIEGVTTAAGKVPSKTETHNRLYGFNEGVRAISSYIQWLNNIPRSVRTRLITEQNRARGGRKEFSLGGPVTGPGPRGVDSVDAVLAPGEHVLTVQEVAALGGHSGVDSLTRSGGAGSIEQPRMVAQGAGTSHTTFVNMTVQVPPTANRAEVGRQVADVLQAYFDRGGSLKVRAP